MNKKIFKLTIDGIDHTGSISDGFHTFDELYDHRITLFIALCRTLLMFKQVIEGAGQQTEQTIELRPWRSKTHHDGSVWDGWFIMGLFHLPGKQISYHLPISRWDETNFAETLEKAPPFDGHTSEDVLKRLKTL